MRTHVIVVLLAVGLAIGLSNPAVDRAASAASPSLDAEVIASGSARTRIGRVSWTAVKGDATNLPFGQVFATPDGYAAFEPFPSEHGSRFWTSADGLDWSVAPMPVPTEGMGVAQRRLVASTGSLAPRGVPTLAFERFRLLDRGRPECGRAASGPWHPMDVLAHGTGGRRADDGPALG